ncbi:protein of unknown function [Burkholderia multivorans]
MSGRVAVRLISQGRCQAPKSLQAIVFILFLIIWQAQESGFPEIRNARVRRSGRAQGFIGRIGGARPARPARAENRAPSRPTAAARAARPASPPSPFAVYRFDSAT